VRKIKQATPAILILVMTLTACSSSEVLSGDLPELGSLFYPVYGHDRDTGECNGGPDGIEDPDYSEWRDPFVSYVVHFSAGGIAEAVNLHLMNRRYNKELDEIGHRSQKLRESLGG